MCNLDSQVPVLYPTSTFAFNVSKHEIEPAFYDQAKRNPHWELAIQQELEALQTNYTWDIVSLPKGKKPISYRWIYKLKYKIDGSINRYKAQLVAKGFTQKEGIDYPETFYSVVKFNAI